MIPDPRDPSYVGALIYFDRAAQSMSFAKAAGDLGVTPSAVSHRIAALEAALGARLFERDTRSIRLTQEGTELALVTASLWNELQQVTARLTQKEILRVSIGPYLSTQWLMPRLQAFEQDNPGLRVDLQHVIGAPESGSTDVSIIWSPVSNPPVQATRLFEAACVPVAAAKYRDIGEFWETAIPPIHYRDRQPWKHWLQVNNLPQAYAERGEVLPDPNLVFEAAAHGRGIAIGFLPFVNTMIAQDRLVVVHGAAVPAEQCYWLRVNNRNNPFSDRFADWVSSESAIMQLR